MVYCQTQHERRKLPFNPTKKRIFNSIVILGVLPLLCFSGWGCSKSTSKKDNIDASHQEASDQIDALDVTHSDTGDPTNNRTQSDTSVTIVPEEPDGSTAGVWGHSDSGEPDAGTVDAQVDAPGAFDAGETPTQPSIELCNGTSELRLVMHYKGSFYPNLTSAVLWENGGSTLLLDGNCNVYLQKSIWYPIHTRILSATEEQQLIEELQISKWPKLVGIYVNCWDCMHVEAWADGYLISVIGGAAVTTEPSIDIHMLGYNYRFGHYDEGEPVTGAVRYTLFLEPNGMKDSAYYRGAKPWPFGDPQPFVSTLGDQKVFVAEGTEAEILRDLWNKALSGEISRYVGSNSEVPAFIPFVQPDGTQYGLFVRDTTPFEDENGRLMLPFESPLLTPNYE